MRYLWRPVQPYQEDVEAVNNWYCLTRARNPLDCFKSGIWSPSILNELTSQNMVIYINRKQGYADKAALSLRYISRCRIQLRKDSRLNFRLGQQVF